MTVAVRVKGSNAEWAEVIGWVDICGRQVNEAWLLGQSEDELDDCGIELAEVVETAAPVGVKVIVSGLEALDGVPTRAWVTEVYSEGEVEALRAAKVAAVKAEAERRILAVYPITAQINALRASEPLDWIDDVRAASDAIEALIPADAEGIVGFEVAGHAAWPADPS